jgi:hypothetical protein
MQLNIFDALPFIGLLVVTIVLTLVIVGGLLGIALLLFVKLVISKQREEESLKSTLLQVLVPKENEVKIDAADQMFSAFTSLYKSAMIPFLKHQPNISFEIVATSGSLKFYINTPEYIQDLVEKQIHATYPGAEIRVVEEYNIFSKEGKVAYASLKLRGANYLPLRTYKELVTDPLSSITSAMAKMREGEGAVVQILVAPAGTKWVKKGYGFVKGQRSQESNSEKPKPVDAKQLEAVEQKIAKPGFHTEIRIVICAADKGAANMHLSNIKAGFEQFNGAYNSFKKRKIWFKKAFLTNFIYRYMPLIDHPSILNSEELASLYHFPNKSIETPYIHWLNSKRAAAPANLPTTGLYLGNSVFRGTKRPIFISDDDRRRHMYIIGKTGTGKSEFLKQMALQDINEGKGLCFMDPHGTAITDILQLIPPERAEDVIYFNPSDLDYPLGINLLEAETEEQKHFMVNSIIGLMYKLYDPHQTGIIGPRFEHAIRNAMLTVMSVPGNTFIEVVRVLTDSKYMQELLPYVNDPMVRRYWTDQIAQTSDFHKSEVLDYIVSKFGRFVTNKMMRNIIGQSKSAFDFRKVMDEKKILLVNLAKGEIGEENSNFLGLVLVPRILVAAMSRSDYIAKGIDFPDFYLYVDEFQNFATSTFADILSEARKFKLNLIVANQFIGQMEENIKNAIFGNAGTIVSFRVGVTDANYLQHEFQPTFNEQDLINIERFNAYMHTLVNGEPTASFSLDTTKDIKVERSMMSPELAEMIRELSRLKFGIDRQTIETDMQRRSNL